MAAHWICPVLAVLAFVAAPSPGEEDGAPATPQAKKKTYQEIEVADGGTIVGRVIWKGPRPALVGFRIDKNPEICRVGESPNKPSRRLALSEKGGVKDTVVYIEGILRGKPLFALPRKQKLNQIHCEYHPRMFVIPKKGKLEMTTADSTLHNIHMKGAASYNLPFPIKGQTITRPFRKAGIARVVCDAGHGWMSAYIHVVTHPYYAITDGEGRFRLEDVPPGKYTVAAWHEGWKVVEKESSRDPETGEEFVKGYIFSEPVILTQKIEVLSAQEVSVGFELSNDS